MPISNAMKITLYDPETNEEKETYSRSFIPWKLLKKAVQLGKLDPNEMTEEDIDMIADLVVEVFGNRFSRQDLDEGADVQEMLTVVMAIVARATKIIGENPTAPGKGRKK